MMCIFSLTVDYFCILWRSLPDIIGRNGSCIKIIQDQFKVKLNIPDTSNRDPSITKIRIGVAGYKDQVAQAKEVIKEITQYFYSRITHPNLTHEELDIAPESYSLVIGPKGSEIRHIQSNFKVSVHIPNSESFLQKVIIIGQAAAVQKAKAYVEKVITRATMRYEEYQSTKTTREDENQEPHEEWMDQYTYKRTVALPTPPKVTSPAESNEAPFNNISIIPSTEKDTKPSWKNIAAPEGWYQNSSM